jgi:hypothetical protein
MQDLVAPERVLGPANIKSTTAKSGFWETLARAASSMSAVQLTASRIG